MENDVHEKNDFGCEGIGSVLSLVVLTAGHTLLPLRLLSTVALSASPWNTPAKRVELIAKHIAPSSTPLG
jgi:hypothetical protein